MYDDRNDPISGNRCFVPGQKNCNHESIGEHSLKFLHQRTGKASEDRMVPVMYVGDISEVLEILIFIIKYLLLK